MIGRVTCAQAVSCFALHHSAHDASHRSTSETLNCGQRRSSCGCCSCQTPLETLLDASFLRSTWRLGNRALVAKSLTVIHSSPRMLPSSPRAAWAFLKRFRKPRSSGANPSQRRKAEQGRPMRLERWLPVRQTTCCATRHPNGLPRLTVISARRSLHPCAARSRAEACRDIRRCRSASEAHGSTM